MSNYDYEDEDDNNNVDTSTDLIKQLRKANKQKEKELAELKELQKFAKQQNMPQSYVDRIVSHDPSDEIGASVTILDMSATVEAPRPPEAPGAAGTGRRNRPASTRALMSDCFLLISFLAFRNVSVWLLSELASSC